MGSGYTCLFATNISVDFVDGCISLWAVKLQTFYSGIVVGHFAKHLTVPHFTALSPAWPSSVHLHGVS